MKSITPLILALILVLFLANCKKEDPDLPEIEVLGVGQAAEHLLSGEKYKQLVLEIVAVNGHEPQASTVNNIKAFLEARLNKPGGISIVQKTVTSPGTSAYTTEKLLSLEEQYRSVKGEGEKITAYIFFADAGHVDDTQNSKVLGVAYRSTSMAIFQKTVKDNSGALGQPSREKLETTIAHHEIGHILGLVDVGTPMQTHHKLHGNHCDNEDCLMYYAVETTDVLAALLGSPIPELDQNCLNDLKANGGK